MPADPDEDSVLTPPAPRPLAPAAPAPSAAPGSGFAWGVVGFLHEAAELTTQPGSRGVVRYVNGDVSYAAAPLPGGWKPTPGTPGRYEMAWPSDPATARTLTRLRNDLDSASRSGGLKSATSPLLVELDAVVDRLLEVATKLHAANWTLGLVQPGNVVLGANHAPHLIDLGYTWKGSFGPPPWDASPGRPGWLDAPSEWLSHVPAVRRQFADPAATHFDRVDPVEDVRTLGRLFAWLLTGQPRGEVFAPSRSSAPELWALLAEASAGDVPTARGLRARLADNPLSDHFADRPTPPAPPALAPPMPPKPTPAGVPWLPIVAGAAVLLLAIVGIGYAVWPSGPEGGTDPSTKATTPELVKPPEPLTVPTRTPEQFAADLKTLDEAIEARDMPAATTALKALYAPGDVPPKDDAARQYRREKFVTLGVAEYKTVLLLSKQPPLRIACRVRMNALVAQLKSLADGPPLPPGAASLRDKEKQCLELASQLASQLAS